MILHKIHERITLSISTEQAWDFFSNPHNLAVITPPELGLKVGSDVPERVYPGMIISYKIQPLPGWKKLWVTEIKDIVQGEQFVDEQRFGPYKFWHHLHRLNTLNSGTEVEDIVHYSVPFSAFGGELIHSLLIKKQLKTIFEYRRNILTSLFPTE